MTNPQNQNDPETFLYKGHAVPKALRIVYVLFLVWAIGYFLLYILKIV